MEYVVVIRYPRVDGKFGHTVTRRKAVVVDGLDFDHAADEAIRKESVYDLKIGIELEVLKIGETVARYRAKYNKEPMNENHTPTDAELIVERTAILTV